VVIQQRFTLAPIRRSVKGRRKEKVEAKRTVRISEKDPVDWCGKGTTVTRLYRVEETLDRTRIHHLVFFDRHGWYCEHGKQCSAVKDVQKFTKFRT
jgi:hypothetical protein